jgi:hypothetical protein
MGKLERARIYVLKKDAAEKDKNNADSFIEVCFNPKEYSLDKTVQWDAEKASSDAPPPEFKQPTPMTLTVTLQFDTYEERISVRDKWMRKLERLTYMQGQFEKGASAKQKQAQRPPVILFVWGSFTFKGVIESLGQKYTMFLSDGTPVRADATLKIRNVMDVFDADGKVNDDAPGQSNSRFVDVMKDDRLYDLAKRHLGAESRWSEIAELNGIVDPISITDGNGDRPSTLEIPES